MKALLHAGVFRFKCKHFVTQQFGVDWRVNNSLSQQINNCANMFARDVWFSSRSRYQLESRGAVEVTVEGCPIGKPMTELSPFA